MPIKFACPKCKSVMTVKDEMAGKSGKCKCGNTVQVPKPKPAAEPAPASIGGAFDELTESDFGRESPYEQVYNPKKLVHNAAALGEFQSDEEKMRLANRGKLTGLLILIAVLNFLNAIGAIGLAVSAFVATAAIATASKTEPLLAAGTSLVAGFAICLALALIGGGVGILLKKKFGWFLTATVYVSLVVARVSALVAVVMAGFDQIQFFAAMIPLVITLGITMYLYNSDVQEVFKIRKALPGILAAILGISVTGGLIGLGMAAAQKDKAAPAATNNGGY